MGLVVTWKLMHIGLCGDDDIPICFSSDDVLEYLDGLLTTVDDETDKIIALICEDKNSEGFKKLIKKYADEETSVISIEKRKLKVFLLKDLINNISDDCLYGLMELIDFWHSIGDLQRCPITFPITNDEKSINSFFTEETYDLCINDNLVWINSEISAINKLENRDRGNL